MVTERLRDWQWQNRVRNPESQRDSTGIPLMPIRNAFGPQIATCGVHRALATLPSMRVPRFLRITLAVLAAIILLAAISVASFWIYFHPHIDRTNGVVYGHRHGRELTLDVLRPARPNGVGVLLMVSGGWKSGRPGSFPPWTAAALLRRGYTIFPGYHLSQPEATV